MSTNRQPTLFETLELAPGDRVRYVNGVHARGNRDIKGTVQRIVPADDGDRALVKWDTGHELTAFVSELERA